MTAAILDLQRLQILRRFTAVWDNTKEFTHPWVQDGMAYATNRHWCVRMPAEKLGKLPAYRKGEHPMAAPLFEAAPFDRLAAMPQFRQPEPCMYCTGGKVNLVPCRHCDHKPLWSAHSPFECAGCEGTGREPIPYLASSPHPSERCPECSGTAWQFGGAYTQPVGNTWFMGCYLQAISELPGVLFALSDDPMGGAAFRWDDGEGLLKPCHPPKVDTLEVNTEVH